MIKRMSLPLTFAALLMMFTAGCIVINVSRSDDKKSKPKVEHEHEDADDGDDD